MSSPEMIEQKEPIRFHLGNDIEMVFRHIPAGAFRMGQRGFQANEEPVTEVFVAECWMAETPVTRAQYKIMAAGCSAALEKGHGFSGIVPKPIKTEEDRRMPVVEVNWHEAGIVARWLRGEMRKQKKLPSGYRVDLPSEAEWEKACRAGTETDYFSGDGEAALKKVGWFGENRDSGPYPVKSKPANGWGLSDCHGSVWQWCRDAMRSDSQRLRVPGERDLSDDGDQANRVLRGGSWYNSATFCRSACRDWFRPGYRNRDIGFRLGLFPGSGDQEAGGPRQEAEPRREREGGTTDLATRGGGAWEDVRFPRGDFREEAENDEFPEP